MSQLHESLPSAGGNTHSSLALVLGGGGSAGQAWLIGVVAGLAAAGLDMTEAADLVIGTSAGATAAAWVRSGIPPAQLYASVISEQAQPSGAPGAPEQAQPSGPPGAPGHAQQKPAGLPMATLFERMRAIGAAAASAADLQRAMGAFGLESDAVLAPGAQRRRAVVAARLPHHEWPERPMLITAVDAHTGELVAFDRQSGADLVDAVAASTAMPGPTVAINGRRYIDGGVRSAENADLASGYANVVVLSPLGGPRPQRPGQFEGLRRFPDTELASQVRTLRREGSHVEVVTPDADSLAAMGTNMMDLAARIPTARAGFAQGQREAGRLAFH